MRQVLFFSSVILFSAMISSCCSAKKAANTQTSQEVSIPGPKVIIYQTTKDFSMFVPVILSDDKESLVSYPDIKDVYYNGVLAYPTKLNQGFLLDNRGITKNVAFINLTYEQYSKLDKTPDAVQLMKMIVDKNPLSKMYSCGVRSTYTEIEKELNLKIDKGDFSSFTKIK